MVVNRPGGAYKIGMRKAPGLVARVFSCLDPKLSEIYHISVNRIGGGL